HGEAEPADEATGKKDLREDRQRLHGKLDLREHRRATSGSEIGAPDDIRLLEVEEGRPDRIENLEPGDAGEIGRAHDARYARPDAPTNGRSVDQVRRVAGRPRVT